MYKFETVSVIPQMPEKIKRLWELAYNFWFSWNAPCRALFRAINPELWTETSHNPVKFLMCVQEKNLQTAAASEQFMRDYQRVLQQFDHYMTKESWFEQNYPEMKNETIAYFSAEFGLHESHPIYSGGLGLLAGDHLKSASDLGLPLVGVGLLYEYGYFTQMIDQEGQQQAAYILQDFAKRPVFPVLTDGQESLIKLLMGEKEIWIKLWQCHVGRIQLYLLDTNVWQNPPEFRQITSQLYGGNRNTRIAQEIVLGIGGVKALRYLGINPTAWHINEGHAAFLILERIREMMAAGLSFQESREIISNNTLFTTHTPVPAGHDLFQEQLVKDYLGRYCQEMGLDIAQLLEMGWDQERQEFNMTLLALKQSDFCNGVSKLHAQVSQKIFKNFYPQIPVEEIPVSHVTNGIHTSSWLAQDLKQVYQIYLGEDWEEQLTNQNIWQNIYNIPDNLLWMIHKFLKEKLVNYARENLKARMIRNQEPLHRIKEAEQYLNCNALTLGFARRFATYKRATLLFKDRERLKKILNNPERPVQIIFAGKAHPADVEGQNLLKEIIAISQEPDFLGKIIFLENYDIHIARNLVQGVDVWLNTPRRPQEASGTSGQKAAVNGVLNFSILDGWWPEAYDQGNNGFAIGEAREYQDEAMQDKDDSFSLYNVLEEEIIPLYFKQVNGIPLEWVKKMKNALASISPAFSTERMVQEYTNRFYILSIQRWHYFNRNNYQAAARLSHFKDYLTQNWPQVKITRLESSASSAITLGDPIKIQAWVQLGAITPQDIALELVYGQIDQQNNFSQLTIVPLQYSQEYQPDGHYYQGTFHLPQGTYSYTVRVVPKHSDLCHKFELPLIAWPSCQDAKSSQ